MDDLRRGLERAVAAGEPGAEERLVAALRRLGEPVHEARTLRCDRELTVSWRALDGTSQRRVVRAGRPFDLPPGRGWAVVADAEGQPALLDWLDVLQPLAPWGLDLGFPGELWEEEDLRALDLSVVTRLADLRALTLRLQFDGLHGSWLQSLRHLEELTIDKGCVPATWPAGLDALERLSYRSVWDPAGLLGCAMPRLQELDLALVGDPTQTLSALGRFPTLRAVRLTLDAGTLTRAHADVLRALPALQELEVGVEDQGAPDLLRALEGLPVRRFAATAEQGAKLHDVPLPPTLRALSVAEVIGWGQHVGAAELAPLEPLQELEELGLGALMTTHLRGPDALEVVTRLPRLRALDLGGTTLDGATLEPLGRAHGLVEVDLRVLPPPASVAALLPQARTLRSLTLWVDEVEPEPLVGELLQLTGLRSLSVTTPGAAACWKRLVELPALDTLSIFGGEKLPPDFVEALAAAPALRTLHLSGVALTVAGVRALARTGLRRLEVEDPRREDGALGALGALPELTHLELRGARWREDDVRALAAAPRLRAIRWRDAEDADALRDALARHRPDCEVEVHAAPRGEGDDEDAGEQGAAAAFQDALAGFLSDSPLGLPASPLDEEQDAGPPDGGVHDADDR